VIPLSRLWLRCSLILALLLCGCGSPPAALPVHAADELLMREHPERLIVLAVANRKERLPSQAGSTLTGYSVTQRYAVGSNARETLEAVKKAYGLKEIAAWPITALRLHCVVLELPPGAGRDELLAALGRDTRVELAQPLQSFSGLTSSETDSKASGKSGYNDPYATLQHGFVDVKAEQAHQLSRGQGVGIAIIDTGVDTSHPDLQGRIATARNFVDRDEAQFGRDRHGTEVAGIIAAVANNRQGIVGIAPEARLSIYKACWARSAAEGGGARCNSFTLAQALAASLDDGARIINLSLGGPPDELLGRLVGHAVKKGRIVIGAVPPDGDLAGFPVGVQGVIAVDTRGRAAGRSGVLQAPGRDILTLEPGGHYDFSSGSSLATAHVSAVAALLLQAQPELDASALRALLERSQTATADGGSIDACAALAGLRKKLSCPIVAETPVTSLSPGARAR
jgi:subtilisin family serine protease